MLTEFGKLLRKIRIDHGEILKDMATKLGVSSAYLSAVEVGKRNIPESWNHQIISFYSLNAPEAESLKRAADLSLKNVTVNFERTGGTQRQAALVFARNFEDMSEETAKKLLSVMNRNSK